MEKPELEQTGDLNERPHEHFDDPHLRSNTLASPILPQKYFIPVRLLIPINRE